MIYPKAYQHFIFLGLVFFILIQGSFGLTENTKRKDGKVLSLFSVVTFKNSPCRATTNNNYNGTCFTASECTNKGGTSSGNCASGFGVCCVFTISASGGTVTQNATYLQNPSYPSVYTSNSALTYTVNKCSADVCWLRLDFDTFTILGPTTSTELDGNACADKFTITVSTGQSFPQICGKNTGQHIYVDIGTGASDTSTLGFTFSATATTIRTWNIKVSQISCFSQSAPPNGCLQYFYSASGRLTTFNFLDSTIGHLASQKYAICIRPEMGMCCIKYQVCSDQTRAYSFDDGATAVGATAISSLDTVCSLDFIEIPASSSCNSMGTDTSLHTRYCGGAFNIDKTASGINVPICSCSTPFRVGINTDAVQDSAIANTANVQVSRGLCLDYSQLPCN